MRKVMYGHVTAVTPDNGMVRVTIAQSPHARNIDVFTSAKSQYVRCAEVALARGIEQRLEVRDAKRHATARDHNYTPCFQIVNLHEVA